MEHLRKRWLQLVASKEAAKFAVEDEVMVDGRKGRIVALYPDTGGEQQYSVKTDAGFTRAREQNLTKAAAADGSWYRGIPVQFDASAGVQLLESCARGDKTAAAQMVQKALLHNEHRRWWGEYADGGQDNGVGRQWSTNSMTAVPNPDVAGLPARTTAAHPKIILGERGQLDESQWYLAEPVPVSLLKKLRLHERTRGTGPLTPADLAKPISILWNPWTGRANLGDGNHRVNQALADGVKSLLAVVDVWPDWIRDFDPKVTEPLSPHEVPRRFETNDVVSPSEAGFPTMPKGHA